MTSRPRVHAPLGLSMASLLVVGCATPTKTMPRATRPTVVAVAPTTSTLALEYGLVAAAVEFEHAAVGYGGDLPETVIAYRRILRAPDARALFLSLAREVRPAARLYGVCGLADVDPEAMAGEVARLVSSTEEVETQNGCLGGLEALGDLVLRHTTSSRARDELRGTGRTWREGGHETTCGGRDARAWVDELERLTALEAGLAVLGPARAGDGDGLRETYAQREPLDETAARPARDDDALELDPGARKLALERVITRVSEACFEEPLAEARERIVGALVAIGPASLHALVPAIDSGGAQVRMGALQVIAWLGRWGAPAAPAVLRALAHPDPRVRWLAIHALRALRVDAGRREMLALLDRPGEEPQLLRDALLHLERRLRPDASAVPTLMRLLTHPHPEVRERAMETLTEAGHDAAPALPVLRSAVLSAEEDGDWAYPLCAIVRLEPGLAAVTLAELALETDRDEVRDDVLSGFPDLEVGPARAALEAAFARAGGTVTGERTSALIAALRTEQTRAYALALLVLEPTASSALRGLLADGDPMLRALAISVLRMHGVPGLLVLAASGLLHVEPFVLERMRAALRGDDEDRLALLRWLAAQAEMPAGRLQVVAGATRGWTSEDVEQACLDAAIDVLAKGEDGKDGLRRLANDARVIPATRARAREALGIR